MPLPRRTLLDRVIHYRVEPDVNAGAPDDERDTTTPSALAADLRKLALGDGLDTAGRNLLVNWMRSATTGLDLVRAGVTKDWAAADKSGSGDQGEVNDVAVVWPPHRAPLVITAYTVPTDPKSTARRGVVAEATAIAVNQLVR